MKIVVMHCVSGPLYTLHLGECGFRSEYSPERKMANAKTRRMRKEHAPGFCVVLSEIFQISLLYRCQFTKTAFPIPHDPYAAACAPYATAAFLNIGHTTR